MARQFGADDRRVLAERVKFWKGPPPRDLAANPTLLAKMASYYEVAWFSLTASKTRLCGSLRTE